MKTIIVYNGKTGFTKKYADWIAEELKCSILSYEYFTKKVIEENDIIIFGSRVHAGKIEHLQKLKSQFVNKSNQKLIVFACGATPVFEKKAIDKIWINNLSESEIKSIPHFYFQSGLNYEKMGFLDRTIMKTVAKLMSKKQNKTNEEAGFTQAVQRSYDISFKEFIFPLVNCVKRANCK